MNTYIAGINAASQEVLSTTRGVRINPIIKRYCVFVVITEAPVRYISNGPIAFKFYTDVKYLKLHKKIIND